MSEGKFEKWLIEKAKSEGLWAEPRHPGMGSMTGIPDIEVMAPFGIRLPVELKIGEITPTETLKTTLIRPDQARWGRKFRAAGGMSGFAAGIPMGGGEWIIAVMSLDKALDGGSMYRPGEYFTVPSVESMVRAVEGSARASRADLVDRAREARGKG